MIYSRHVGFTVFEMSASSRRYMEIVFCTRVHALERPLRPRGQSGRNGKRPQDAAEERLEVVRQNTAGQIMLKTKCMVRQNTVSRIESRKTAGSLPSVYYVMCLTFYLKIFP